MLSKPCADGVFHDSGITMPVFPWRFIDSLLGRSNPDDAEPATAEYINQRVSRLLKRLEADESMPEHLGSAGREAFQKWAATMLGLRASAVLGWSRRDANVQLGAVFGAIRVVIQVVNDALTRAVAPSSSRAVKQLRSLESEMAAPLYPHAEQLLVRARLDGVITRMEQEESVTEVERLVRDIAEALTPPD
ncbi:MAG: hypothetical protein ACKVVP_09980 [Chloroflexota bacterium]